jgi:hypothetical protein
MGTRGGTAVKKNDVRLYNVLFPVWMLVTLPVAWYLVIPGNFVIDSLVLIIAMKALKMEARKRFYFRHILPVFCFGFLADILASLPMYGALMLELGGDYADSPLMTVPCVALAGVLIYVFDYYITFRNCEPDLRKKLSLTYAIATAPYTYMIPSRWLYGF